VDELFETIDGIDSLLSRIEEALDNIQSSSAEISDLTNRLSRATREARLSSISIRRQAHLSGTRIAQTFSSVLVVKGSKQFEDLVSAYQDWREIEIGDVILNNEGPLIVNDSPLLLSPLEECHGNFSGGLLDYEIGLQNKLSVSGVSGSSLRLGVSLFVHLRNGKIHLSLARAPGMCDASRIERSIYLRNLETLSRVVDEMLEVQMDVPESQKDALLMTEAFRGRIRLYLNRSQNSQRDLRNWFGNSARDRESIEVVVLTPEGIGEIVQQMLVDQTEKSDFDVEIFSDREMPLPQENPIRKQFDEDEYEKLRRSSTPWRLSLPDTARDILVNAKPGWFCWLDDEANEAVDHTDFSEPNISRRRVLRMGRLQYLVHLNIFCPITYYGNPIGYVMNDFSVSVQLHISSSGDNISHLTATVDYSTEQTQIALRRPLDPSAPQPPITNDCYWQLTSSRWKAGLILVLSFGVAQISNNVSIIKPMGGKRLRLRELSGCVEVSHID